VRGAGDPDDFTRYLNGREVSCDPVEKVDAYRCTVDGHDLSEVVLFNGGAKSTPNAPPELRAAEEKARVAKIGVWSR
jgi:endonuclease YncB( thermonuclease family)